jgi:hypothetical protein
MHEYSDKWKEITRSVDACELPLSLIEIRHPLINGAARFAADNQDLKSNGNTYLATGAEIIWPDEKQDSLPRATIRLNNVDKSAGQMFEKSHGARGAVVTFSKVLRSAPDFVEQTFEIEAVSVTLSAKYVDIQLGFDDLLNKVSVPETFRAQNKPGLF